MSNALSRLRRALDDALFVRQGRGVEPTPRAVELAEPIARALNAAREVFATTVDFDPRTSKRTFSVSGGDYALMTLLPQVMARIRTEAPDVDIRFRFIEKDRIYEYLDDGTLDVALGVFPERPKRFDCTVLFEEQFRLLIRRDAAESIGPLSEQQYAALPHVLVTERGDDRGAVDVALAKQGLARRIALTVPSVLIVKHVLLETDLVATVGQRIARLLADDGQLALLDVPIALAPWAMTLIAPRRRKSDPAVTWLTRIFVEQAKMSADTK
jgi:DNA-binding transcriptional LysR family regulator